MREREKKRNGGKTSIVYTKGKNPNLEASNERKVVVGSAVQKHGFIFNFEKGNDSSSSEEADSF